MQDSPEVSELQKTIAAQGRRIVRLQAQVDEASTLRRKAEGNSFAFDLSGRTARELVTEDIFGKLGIREGA